MKKRLIMLLALVLVLSLLFTSCQDSSTGGQSNSEGNSSTSGESGTNGNQKIAEEIKIGRRQDSIDLDPVTQDGNVNIWMFNLVLEGLVKTSDDGTKIEPGLAKSWDVSEDGKVYTFHLEDNLKFSDGNPVTKEDIEWSLTRVMEKENVWSFSADGIDKVEVPDDKTVIITLDAPRPSILAQLAMFSMTIQQKAYYDKVGQAEYSKGPIGTGPYVFKEWSLGEYLLLEKNPNYRVEGVPKTQRIRFLVIPDDATRVLQLSSGQIDAATELPFNQMEEISANANLKAEGIPSTEVSFILLNNNFKPLSDVKVRQALQYGTDKQAIVDFVLKGFGKPGVSFAPPTGMYWNDQLQPYAYDVEKAKQLLTEAGYPDGFDIELLVRAGNSTHEQVSVILKEQWQKIGVNVNILSLEAATAMEKYRALNYEATLGGWTNDLPDPMQQTEYVINPDVVSAYYSSWVNQEAIDLMNEGKIEIDPAKREEIYKKIQEIHYNETPMIAIYYSSYPVGMSKQIQGFVQTPLGNYRFENLIKIE